MNGRTEYVKSGTWVDYDQPGWLRYRVLVTDNAAQIISNTIAVALTLTLPRLLIFLKHLLSHRTKKPSQHQADDRSSQGESIDLATLSDGVSSQEPDEDNLEEDPDHPLPQTFTLSLPRATYWPRFSSRIVSGLRTTFQEAGSLGDALTRLGRDHLAMNRIEVGSTSDGLLAKFSVALGNFRDDKWGFAFVTAIIFALFALFVGEQISAIFAANIVSGSMALSVSPNCGIWVSHLDNPYNTSAGLDILSWITEKNLRAVSYAETCYGENATAEACNIFYNRTVSYSDIHNSSCPFLGDVCLYGDTSAYTLDTGFVDSNVLGVNGERRYQIRRKTTCSPLITNASYVRYGRDHSTTYVEYYYGYNGTRSLTFMQQAYPSYSDSSLGGYWTQSFTGQFQTIFSNKSTILLLPEFRATNSVVSLIFVRPKAVFYFEPSFDPIFPAQQVYNGPGYLEQIYYNNLPHATVLGCADTAEIRDPDTGLIWHPVTMDWNDLKSRQGIERLNLDKVFKENLLNPFLLLGASMLGSSISTIILTGPYFDAQKKLINGLSIALDREQWKVEARKMFETSLARMQGIVLDVARGRGVDDRSAKNALPEINSSICNMIKFPTLGWKNISLFWMTVLPTLAFFIWLFSIEVEEKLVLVWFYLYVLKPFITLIWFLLKSIWRTAILSLRWL